MAVGPPAGTRTVAVAVKRCARLRAVRARRARRRVPGRGGHRVLRAVVARAVVLRDAAATRRSCRSSVSDTLPRPPVLPSRFHTAMAMVLRAVRVQDPVGDREAVLRAQVVDVVADLPAVDEERRRGTARRVVGERQPERGVLARAAGAARRRCGTTTRPARCRSSAGSPASSRRRGSPAATSRRARRRGRRWTAGRARCRSMSSPPRTPCSRQVTAVSGAPVSDALVRPRAVLLPLVEL